MKMLDKANSVVRGQYPESPPTILPSEFWFLDSVFSNQICIEFRPSYDF